MPEGHDKPNAKGNYTLLLSAKQKQTFYIYVFGHDIGNNEGTYIITIQRIQNAYLADISPKIANNTGNVTLTLNGLCFQPDSTVHIVSAFNTINAESVIYHSPEKIYATFNLQEAEAGTYTVYLENNLTLPAILENALDVNGTSEPGKLEVKIDFPEYVRYNRTYSGWIEYKNSGQSDIPIPIFNFSNDQSMPMSVNHKNIYQMKPNQIIGMSKNSALSCIPPGQKNKIPFSMVIKDISSYKGVISSFYNPKQKNTNGGVVIGFQKIAFELNVMQFPSTPVNWDTEKEKMMPDYINVNLWDRMWPQLVNHFGYSWENYGNKLKTLAIYFNNKKRHINNFLIGNTFIEKEPDDQNIYDAGSMINFIMNKANGEIHPRSVLTSSNDVFIKKQSLSLSFSRIAPQPIPNRFYLGALGRGWYHNYDFRLESFSEDKVIKIYMPGTYKPRMFQSLNYNYKGAPGDTGSFSKNIDGYILKEITGMTYRFNTDKKLVAIEDRYQNSLILEYDQDNLIRVSHSDGDFIDIYYNAYKRVSQIFHQNNLLVQYNYDTTGQYLKEVIQQGNIITTYDYNSDDNSVKSHALNTITYPDFTHYYFIYNNEGLLIEEKKDLDFERITYEYQNYGIVIVSDSYENSTRIQYGPNGEIYELEKPDGAIIYNSYNQDSLLSKVTDSAGRAYSFAYDSNGNIVAAKNPLNQVTITKYDISFDKVSEVIDAKQNNTDYSYNELGKLYEILYPDTTRESFQYDSYGNVSNFYNRRNQGIEYFWNNNGQLTRKVYPDGRTIEYCYNNDGLLYSTIDSETGTINMQYDERKFLTYIEYPGNIWFSFEYNNSGKRTKRTDYQGNELHYQYTTIGYLEKISDKNDMAFVHYIYDNKGRLIQEAKGNGTYTTYAFDNLDQLINITHYDQDSTVISFFDYQYNDQGNCTSMTTNEGMTAYEYDALDQLIRVTYPDGSDEGFEYDEAGNRTRVTIGSNVETCSTNNMNQYTNAGNTLFSYDQDGNLIYRAGSSGTTTYEYDAENRLVKVISPANDIWEYTYDALGNRSSVIHNGVMKRYINDPIGLGNITFELDESNNITSEYIHGFGLVTLSKDSETYYYNFDKTGSVREITNSNGVVVNSYNYAAFGETTVISNTIENPFQYVGKFGVMEEPHGLNYMRARYYDAKVGRFTTEDPIGIEGGFNLYEYCGNNPENYIDIDGFQLYQINKKFSDSVNAVNYYYKNGKNYYLGFEPKNPENPKLFEEGGDIFKYFDKGILREFAKTHDKWMDNIDNPILWNALNFPTMIPAFLFSLPNNVLNLPTPPDNSNSNDSDGSTKKDIWIAITKDPNEKVAETGIGDEKYVGSGDELYYTIYFENKPEATAPVQELFVNDQLSPYLDWGTLKISDIGFGDTIISSLSGKMSTIEQVLVNDWLIDFNIETSLENGELSCTILCLDPETGELPVNALAGFLPPEDETGAGQGYITFSIKTKANLPIGIRIANKASIIFDTNAAIETNVVINTIGSGVPVDYFIPGINNGSSNISIDTALSWNPVEFADSYSLYLWQSDNARPLYPVQDNLTSTTYYPTEPLCYSTTYSWQIIAKNIMGATAGPIWSFTTEALPNSPPIANDDFITLIEDTIITIDVLSNDEDTDHDPLNIISTSHPVHGTTDINNDLTITYTPDNNYFGQDSFTYTIEDDNSAICTATVFITINAANDAPYVSDIPDQVIIKGNNFTLIVLNAFVEDVDNTNTEIIWSFYGNEDLYVNIDENNIAAVTTPNLDWIGSESITFVATDQGLLSNSDTAIFTVSLEEDIEVLAPVFSPPGGVYNEDIEVTLTSVIKGVDIYYGIYESEAEFFQKPVYYYQEPIKISGNHKIIFIKAVIYLGTKPSHIITQKYQIIYP